jgi:hypothetical protein
LFRHNPLRLLKRVLAREGAKERALSTYAPGVPRAFFHDYLNFMIQKP